MRTLFLLFCLAFLAGAVAADEVYVPDNLPGSGSSNVIPMQAAFMKTDCRYQALYRASLLGTTGYKITDIAFAPSATGDLKATQFQVRISHYTGGTLSSLMDSNIPSPVTVFDGPMTWVMTSGVWCPLGLTGSFDWNGTDDIVVDIRYKGGVNSGGAGGCYYTRGAIPRSWAYGDYNAVAQSGSDTSAGLKTRFTVTLGPGPLTPGDLIITYQDTSVTSAGNTLRLDPVTSKITTLISSTVSGTLVGNWIQMGPNNREVWVAYQYGSSGMMYRLDRSGAIASSLALPWRVDGFRFTDDGGITWSVGTGTYLNRLVRSDMSFGNVTTLVTGPLPSTSLSHQEVEDDGTVVATSQAGTPLGAITVVDPVNNAIIKSVAGLALTNTIDFHKGNGKAYAVEFGTPASQTAAAGSLFEFDVKLYTITSLIDATTTLGATVDRLNWIEYGQDHSLYLGARHKIFKFDIAQKQIVQTWTFEVDRLRAVTGATIYGNRPLMLDTSGGTKPGSAVGVNISYAHMQAPGAPYYVACSAGLRPGIKLGADTLDLTFDVLFYLSANNLVPGVFKNFQGFLDKNGQATAAVQLPAIASLDGIRFFCGTIAIINSQIVVGNSEGFTVRK